MGGLAVLSMNYTHPLYLGVLLIGTLVMLRVTRGLAAWRSTLMWSGMAVLGVILINPIASSHGTTVFWTGPALPVFGRVTMSLEALLFGLMMGLKMLLLTSLFCLYGHLQCVDQLLDVCGRLAPKTATTFAMTNLLLPRLIRDLQSVQEALKARGAVWIVGPWHRRWRHTAPAAKILLLNTLEGSWQTAEALHARGFGSGTRSSYTPVRWQGRDTLVIATMVPLLILGCWGFFTHHYGAYQFYPTLGSFLQVGELFWILGLSLWLGLLAYVTWHTIT